MIKKSIYNALYFLIFSLIVCLDTGLFYNSSNFEYNLEAEKNIVAEASKPIIRKEIVQKNDLIKLSSRNEKSRLRKIAGGEWQKGIEYFAANDIKSASENFVATLEKDYNISDEDRSAVAFWAYRAFNALNEKEKADLYLEQAANSPQSFYGIIARHIIGKDTLPVNAQISIALDYINKGEKPNTSYVLPNWQPKSGYKVEPALLFAIIRQESEFNPSAKSLSGAIGVMQLMPETASSMARRGKISGSALDPSVSIALGQHYIKRLMDEPEISDNMIFLTAAYNAGPGILHKWLQKIEYNNDPLLFVESIPYGTTRDYVVNVMANYWIYSELLGGSIDSIASISQGKWPLYAGIVKQLSDSASLPQESTAE
ncbi:MAG: lytic transglycosylase domain-containing protein [Pseudomonadota bacterium]